MNADDTVSAVTSRNGMARINLVDRSHVISTCLWSTPRGGQWAQKDHCESREGLESWKQLHCGLMLPLGEAVLSARGALLHVCIYVYPHGTSVEIPAKGVIQPPRAGVTGQHRLVLIA